MKQQVILELTKLFVMQRRALSINKSYSTQRIHALIEKRARQLQACLQDGKYASANKEAFIGNGKHGNRDKTETATEKRASETLTKDVANLQREWIKTKGLLKEMKTVCDSFFYDKQNTYGETGEKNLIRKKSRHIESA